MSSRRPRRRCSGNQPLPRRLQPVFAHAGERGPGICDADIRRYLPVGWRCLPAVATHNTPPAFAECRAELPFLPVRQSHFGRYGERRSGQSTLPICLHEPQYMGAIRLCAAVELGGYQDYPRRADAEGDERSAPSDFSARRSAHSPKSRSNWYRTSPRKQSSPSRTRGCSTNCVSAPCDLTEALEQQTATLRGTQGHQQSQVILSRCLLPCWRRRCASAMLSLEVSIDGMAGLYRRGDP